MNGHDINRNIDWGAQLVSSLMGSLLKFTVTDSGDLENLFY
jgi:hypothetical protein